MKSLDEKKKTLECSFDRRVSENDGEFGHNIDCECALDVFLHLLDLGAEVKIKSYCDVILTYNIQSANTILLYLMTTMPATWAGTPKYNEKKETITINLEWRG